MKQLTANVYVESGLSSCNLGLVTTREGIVLIDTPSRLANAVKWRDEVANRGEVRYLVISEEHMDHCKTGCFFPGVLITSQETRDKLSKVPPGDIIAGIKRADPGALPLINSFRLRLADIAFAGTLTVHLGDHTFYLFALQGHTSGGIGVYIPEERVVFTADCVFHQVKTWLQEAVPDQWLESLRKLAELDVDTIVPGHGAVCQKEYLKEQAGIIQGWVESVHRAMSQGLSQDEAVARISSPDPYPVQRGVPVNEAELNKTIIARLYHLGKR